MALNAITYANMMKMLLTGEHTRADITRGTGLHSTTVAKYVKYLHKYGVVYISDWKINPVSRNHFPCYSLNVDGLPDAPKPELKGRAQIEREYRQRRKAMRLNQMMAGAT